MANNAVKDYWKYLTSNPQADWQQFVKYQKAGGSKGFTDWRTAGKPQKDTGGLSARAKDILERTGGQISPEASATDRAAQARARAAELESQRAKERDEKLLAEIRKQEAAKEGQAPTKPDVTQVGGATGYWGTDPATGEMKWITITPASTPRYEPSTTETGKTKAETDYINAQIKALQDQLKANERGTSWDVKQWKAEQEASRLDREWREREAQMDEQYRNQQLQIQQDQVNWQRQSEQARLEAEKQQRLSDLRANPMSWLQYASEAGETPVVQKWMLPLMPEQYSQLGAGAELPGWIAQGQGGTAGQGTTQGGLPELSGMPELTIPAAQYLARLAPSQRAQYFGYRRARTGETPEDIQWRMWSGGAPTGAGAGASYGRR